MPDYFIIFGAAVRPDGTPSGTLARRIAGALSASADNRHRCFIATGGLGKSGFVESDVISDRLVTAGVDPCEILCDPAARDTLASVRNCDAMIRARGDAGRLTPCTSPYHVPRCALLFWMLGWRVRVQKMPGDFGHLPAAKLVAFYLKEIVALPYDMILLARDIALPSRRVG